MPKLNAEGDQNDSPEKPQILVDEPGLDSVRLGLCAAEPAQSESGTSRSTGTPELVEEPSAPAFPASAASVQGGDESRGTTPSAAAGKGEPGLASEKNIAESYREELLMHSLEALIPDLIKQGRGKEAEIGSRLLVDLTERRITASEAKEIFELIEAKHRGEAVQRNADLSQAATNRNLLLTTAFTLLVLVFAGISISTSHHHRTVHQPGQAQYQGQSDPRFLPVSLETSMHSISGSFATTFTITNKSDKMVALYWLNYQGDRVLYGHLEPGQQLGQLTFLTHPWVVVDDEGKAIMLFLPGTRQNQQIEVR